MGFASKWSISMLWDSSVRKFKFKLLTSDSFPLIMSHIWNQREKCIHISTNMPSTGFNHFWISPWNFRMFRKPKTCCITIHQTNGRVLLLNVNLFAESQQVVLTFAMYAYPVNVMMFCCLLLNVWSRCLFIWLPRTVYRDVIIELIVCSLGGLVVDEVSEIGEHF